MAKYRYTFNADGTVVAEARFEPRGMNPRATRTLVPAGGDLRQTTKDLYDWVAFQRPANAPSREVLQKLTAGKEA